MDSDLKFRRNSTIYISGPTMSGKSVLTARIIQNANEMFEIPPQIIYYCYSVWQPGFTELSKLPNVEMIEGLVSADILKQNRDGYQLVILDDLMSETQNNSEVSKLFTKFAHHWNLYIIKIMQNLFYKNSRTERLNCNYMILLKSPQDALQITSVARQIFPRKQKFLLEAYADATSQPHGYIMIDLSQQTPDNLRVRTKIFPNENTEVYIPK